MNPKKARDQAMMQVYLLFIIALAIYSEIVKNPEENVYSYFEHNPYYVFYLILPMIVFAFFVYKANSWSGIVYWFKYHFLKYLNSFLALIFLTYVVNIIFLIETPTTFIQWGIASVLLLCTFILYLFGRWFEEAEVPPLDRQRLVRMKSAGVLTLITVIPGVVFSPVYHWIFGISWGLGFGMGLMHGIGIMIALSATVADKWWERSGFLIGGLFQVLALFVNFPLELVPLYVRVWVVGIGVVLVIATFVIGLLLPRTSWLSLFLHEMRADAERE